MKRAVMIAAALAGLAGSLPGAGAKAETNSLMAVSMRTFPSDYIGRRAAPECPTKGRGAQVIRKAPVVKAASREAMKVSSAATLPAFGKGAAGTSPGAAPAAANGLAPAPAPGALDLAKPAAPQKPAVTAQIQIPAETAAVTKVALNEAPTRSSAFPAAPVTKAALAPVAAAAPATCKQFLPSVGLLVDVACEK